MARLESSKAPSNPDHPLDDSCGVCWYCDRISKLLPDYDDRYACAGCLKA